MSLISIPYTFSVGNTIIASQHNSNFQTIYNDYNGNITDANIAPGAAIEYTKLALSNSIQKTDLVSGVSNYLVPQGGIIMWSGTIATIPSAWVLCDGTNGTPDLRDQFIVGARSDSGGVACTNIEGSLKQSNSTGVMPSHTHTVNQSAGTTVMSNTGTSYSRQAGGGSNTTDVSLSLSNTGTGTKNIAVYYALAFIMKT